VQHCLESTAFKRRYLNNNNNNNNNNIVICKAHKVNSNAESEAHSVARWAAHGRLCEEDCLETALKGISGGGEPCIKRQIIPDCGCKVAEKSFAKFSGQSSCLSEKLGLTLQHVSVRPNTSWTKPGFQSRPMPVSIKAQCARCWESCNGLRVDW